MIITNRDQIRKHALNRGRKMLKKEMAQVRFDGFLDPALSVKRLPNRDYGVLSKFNWSVLSAAGQRNNGGASQRSWAFKVLTSPDFV